jgi:hypothetical protein
MGIYWTKSSLAVLEEIKEIIINDFKNKNPQKINIKITKKKTLIAVPIPFNKPAFQLFIQDKFYKSYFLKDNKWEEVSD